MRPVEDQILKVVARHNQDYIDPLGWLWERIFQENAKAGDQYEQKVDQAWEEMIAVAGEVINEAR